MLKPRGTLREGCPSQEVTGNKAFVAIIFVRFTGIRPSVSVLPLFHQPLELRVTGVVIRASSMDPSRCRQKHAGSCGFACNTHGLPAGVTKSACLAALLVKG